jgi:hypothetical protein
MAWRQTLRHRRAVEAAERERRYTCATCGWQAPTDVPDHERWSLLDRHDHAEHLARSWTDWSEEGLVRYMQYRSANLRLVLVGFTTSLTGLTSHPTALHLSGALAHGWRGRRLSGKREHGHATRPHPQRYLGLRLHY